MPFYLLLYNFKFTVYDYLTFGNFILRFYKDSIYFIVYDGNSLSDAYLDFKIFSSILYFK